MKSKNKLLRSKSLTEEDETNEQGTIKYLDSRNSTLIREKAQLEQSLSQLNKQLKEHSAISKKLRGELEGQSKILSKRDDQVLRLIEKIKTQDREVSKLQKTISQRNSVISAQEAKLKELDRVVNSPGVSALLNKLLNISPLERLSKTSVTRLPPLKHTISRKSTEKLDEAPGLDSETQETTEESPVKPKLRIKSPTKPGSRVPSRRGK